MAPRETENNAYAKFWSDKERALWYVMVFYGVVNWRACSQAKTSLNRMLGSPQKMQGLCNPLIESILLGPKPVTKVKVSPQFQQNETDHESIYCNHAWG